MERLGRQFRELVLRRHSAMLVPRSEAALSSVTETFAVPCCPAGWVEPFAKPIIFANYN
jgi:hypothetical protein